ncbi:uncharacterized protein LOC127137386 [Lathyrus oleraceus]|uniref:uncharacterized protein LOC127137386 n=1 Tax=Pisum sativum TaxID=3888 RepID=UPI0021CE71B9|nr:uncharacterized protein LOC127137386 [Pisum sativum]
MRAVCRDKISNGSGNTSLSFEDVYGLNREGLLGIEQALKVSEREVEQALKVSFVKKDQKQSWLEAKKIHDYWSNKERKSEEGNISRSSDDEHVLLIASDSDKLTSEDIDSDSKNESELENDSGSESESEGKIGSKEEYDSDLDSDGDSDSGVPYSDGNLDSGGSLESGNILDSEGGHASEVGTSGVSVSDIVQESECFEQVHRIRNIQRRFTASDIVPESEGSK